MPPDLTFDRPAGSPALGHVEILVLEMFVWDHYFGRVR